MNSIESMVAMRKAGILEYLEVLLELVLGVVCLGVRLGRFSPCNRGAATDNEAAEAATRPIKGNAAIQASLALEATMRKAPERVSSAVLVAG